MSIYSARSLEMYHQLLKIFTVLNLETVKSLTTYEAPLITTAQEKQTRKAKASITKPNIF